MPLITIAAKKQPKHGNDVKAKIQSFLEKLGESDTSLGLHIEPINGSFDPRARTGRVDIHLRAVLFRIDPPQGETHYIYVGTWNHDEGTQKAKTLSLQVNPVHGVLELHEAIKADSPALTQVPAPSAAVENQATPLLPRLGFFLTDLIDDFGFDRGAAEAAFRLTSEDAIVDFALGLDIPWQQETLLSMGAGDALHIIRERLGFDQAGSLDSAVDEDAKIIAALDRPASRMQFAYIENNAELRRAIDDEDFGAWRIFLHPEQRSYVEKDYSGPFRLSGGAGTGKTVVLLHRALRLASVNPRARIILSTFSRALADNLRRDMRRLDAGVGLAEKLGDPGILIRGVDQIAADVRLLAGDGFLRSAMLVTGVPCMNDAAVGQPDWRAAIVQAGGALPVSLQSPSFLEDEYAQIVLPYEISDLDAYRAADRSGRGVPLTGERRSIVWQTIVEMRRRQRIANIVGHGEIAAIGTEWLRRSGTSFADHVLVDEGQDLEPAKWKLLRALVEDGQNDLFIAEDAHQRIYGPATILKRFGVKIQGRSRRLTLNYRTTFETLRFALGLLEGSSFDDVEEVEVSADGYRSARTGPDPQLLSAKSDSGQLDEIARVVSDWSDRKTSPGTIAVLASTNNAAKKVQVGLAERGIAVRLATVPQIKGDIPVVMTMHMAKGLEFSKVVLFDLSDGSYPPPIAYKTLPAEDLPDKDKQFRSLIYVAASRARDELVVTWKGSPSRLLFG